MKTAIFPAILSIVACVEASITCLMVGASATATWTNSAGKTCTFTGVVGSNYGSNSAGSGE